MPGGIQWPMTLAINFDGEPIPRASPIGPGIRSFAHPISVSLSHDPMDLMPFHRPVTTLWPLS